MFNLLKTKVNLKQLEIIAKKLASKSLIGDIYLLSGELGAGKTTFIRFFIYIVKSVERKQNKRTNVSK